MESATGLSKPSLIPHDTQNCPLVARVQALQTQLAYYKAICIAYETGKLKPQGNNRRLTIQKINSKELEKMKVIVPGADHLQGFKEDQLKFSEQIQKKIRKGVKKEQDKQGSFCQTPSLQPQNSDFNDNNKQQFLKDKPESLPIIAQSQITDPFVLPLPTIPSPTQIPSQTDKQTEKQTEKAQSTDKQPILPKQIITVPQANLQQTVHRISDTSEKSIVPTLPLIADLCLFGCNEKQLKNVSSEKINQVTPCQLFSMFNYNNKMYYDQVAKYLFPNGLYARMMRHERILSEVNQILLQNVKKHSNFIYELKSELKMQQISPEQRQLLQWLNPSLKLYCISILINDFTMVDPDPILSDKQKSSQSDKSVEQIRAQTNRSDMAPKHKKKNQSKQIKHYNIYSNKKILSIFTFYPFFEFFESILISIFNALKVEKLGIYQNKLQTIHQIDSSYLLHQLQNHYSPMMSEINTTLMVPGLDYEFVLGVDLLKISTDGMKLIDAILGAWVFPVLKIFDKHTFYQILSAIFFEEQVIFVCDNPHILSYTIYLFTQILIRPFRYQHSAIYMVSYWDLLDAPTPIVLGVNKPSAWLDQTELRSGHLYVQIGQEITLIDRRKEEKKVRSDKLKKIVSSFFKSIDRDNIVFFKEKKKKDNVEYNLISTKAEKQLCMVFISSINVFLKEELVDKIPSKQFIDQIQQRFRWSNIAKNQDAATIISEGVIKQMLRVRREKDPFIQKFMRTQIFLTYLFDTMKIDE